MMVYGLKGKLPFFGLLAALTLGGCRRNAPSIQPGKAEVMQSNKPGSQRIGDIEVSSSLNNTNGPFSAQEDITLNIKLRNCSDKDVTVPFLSEHVIQFELKNNETDKDTLIQIGSEKNYGVFRPENSTVPLASNQETNTNLGLEKVFGPFTTGKYSLRIKVEDTTLSFTTAWLDFEVNPMHVVHAQGAVYPEGNSTVEAQALYQTWREDGGKVPRILFRKTQFEKNRETVAQTVSVGDADAGSIPVVVSIASSPAPTTAWVGWLAGGRLTLASIRGKEIHTIVQQIPEKGSVRIIAPLLYSEIVSATSSNARVKKISGAILGNDVAGAFVAPFQSIDSAAIPWLPVTHLPPGEILASRILELNDCKRFVFTVRYADSKLWIEIILWEDGKTIGAAQNVASFPASPNPLIAFDAIVIGSQIKWGLTQRFTSEENDFTFLRSQFGLLATLPNETKKITTEEFNVSLNSSPASITLKLAKDGTPLLLHHDSNGIWAHAKGWRLPLKVNAPKNASFEQIYFRKSLFPRVSFFHPDSGFKSVPVILPNGDADFDYEVDPLQ